MPKGRVRQKALARMGVNITNMKGLTLKCFWRQPTTW